MEPMILNNATELREVCREVCTCSANSEPQHPDQMVAGIMSGNHPAWGADWSQWWDASEGERWGSLRYGPDNQTRREYLSQRGVEFSD